MSWNLSSNSKAVGSFKFGRLTRGGISRSLWEPNPKKRKKNIFFVRGMEPCFTAGFCGTDHLKSSCNVSCKSTCHHTCAHLLCTSGAMWDVHAYCLSGCPSQATFGILKTRQLLCAGVTILHCLNVLRPLRCRPQDDSSRPAV